MKITMFLQLLTEHQLDLIQWNFGLGSFVLRITWITDFFR